MDHCECPQACGGEQLLGRTLIGLGRVEFHDRGICMDFKMFENSQIFHHLVKIGILRMGSNMRVKKTLSKKALALWIVGQSITCPTKKTEPGRAIGAREIHDHVEFAITQLARETEFAVGTAPEPLLHGGPREDNDVLQERVPLDHCLSAFVDKHRNFRLWKGSVQGSDARGGQKHITDVLEFHDQDPFNVLKGMRAGLIHKEGRETVSDSKQKLKIVHTEASLGWGGQEIRVIVELREMARRGHRTILVAPPDSDIFRRGLDAQIETLPLSMRRRDFYQNLRWLSDFFRAEKIDVLNTHSSRDSWLAGCAARRAKVPLVIKTRHISARVSRGWLTRLVYQNLHDFILTTSCGIAEDMVNFNGYNAGRITSVPTGVDLNRFDLNLPRANLRKELGLPEDCQLVGMVSVLRSWKGHPDFLKAARMVRQRYPNAYFVLVGEGPRRKQIEEELLEKGLEEFVFLIGHRDEVPQILKALDIFVLPSYANEGVPQALLQALAMERPVVATKVGGIPEVIANEKNGLLCEPQSPTHLADCIMRLLENPKWAAEMAQYGRQRVVNEFSLNAMIQRLEDLYYRMLHPDREVRIEAPSYRGVQAPQAA